MDQREAMIAAIRAQVEKEKAEKEAKLKQEQGQTQAGAGGSSTSGNAKPQFKTLSAEDLQRLEEKKRRKQAGEAVDDTPFEPSTPVKEEVKEKPVSSAGLDTGLGGVGVQTETGLGGAPAGDSLMGTPTGNTLQGGSVGGGLGGGLGGESLGGGLNISGLDSSVTSIQESSFSNNVVNEQDGGWVSSSADSDIPTIETPVPKKNLDDDGNLISVVPIKQDVSVQDVKSMYNIDFEDEDSESQNDSGAEEAAKQAAEEAAKRAAAEEAEKQAAAEEAAKRAAAEEAAKKAAAEESARKAAIDATKKADEEARKAAERAAKKAAEDETIKRAKEEAAKRKAAEEARKKAAEESARAAYANEIQAKATTANRRLDSAAQRVIEANNKVAALDDQEKNHAKYVDEALAKIDVETENKVLQVKNAEDDRVKAVTDSFVKKREALIAEYEAKEEEAKRQLEDEKAAKTAQLGQIEQDKKDKQAALQQENEEKKEALKQEEIDRRTGLNEEEEKAKADVNLTLDGERQRLEESIKQDAKAAEDALAAVKADVANADNRIQAAIDHVAEIERQLEEAKQAVEREKQKKVEAESLIAAKEEAVAAQKAQAEAKRSELENSFKDKVQQVAADYDNKRESLVSEYVTKQNQLVEEYNSQCAALDSETENLLEQAKKELAGLDGREDANKLNRQAGLEEKKRALAAEETEEIAKAKEQTQSEIDACRQQGEQEKTEYVAKSNDEMEGVRIQLKEAKDEAASLMQVYEITKRSAVEAMESAKRVGIEISMPALDIEIPAGAVKTIPPKSPAAASKGDAKASDVSIPVSVMEFMGKYLDATTIAASVRKSLTEIVANPTGNKNILVLGKHGFGSTVVGNDFARAFYAAGICSSKTIANIKSAALNKRPVESVKDKLKGGCLVVENAGTLTVDRLQEIARVGKDPANDITIIFTGEKDRVNYVIKDAGIEDLFAHTVLMTDVDEAGMFAIAKAYAKQLGYTLESAAESTLKNKLKEIEDGNLDRYLKMVDDAVAKAKTQGETASLASVDFN